MQMLDSIVGVVRKLTEVGLAVVALAVVLQVIFGSNAAFLPGDVVGNVTGIVAALGANAFWVSELILLDGRAIFHLLIGNPPQLREQ